MARKHRFVTVPSGLLMFVCLFLPAMEACSDPVRPYEVGAYPPYLAGVFVAVLALVGPRARRVMTQLARVVLWFCAIGAAVALISELARDPSAWPWIILLLAFIASVCGVLGCKPARDELSSARLVIALALLGVGFFGTWLLEAALYGLHLSAVASIGLLIGGIEWRREILRDRVTGVPTARISAACPSLSPTT